MTKSAEPSTPSGSSETQQRRRQITSYKNTTTSPATDIVRRSRLGEPRPAKALMMLEFVSRQTQKRRVERAGFSAKMLLASLFNGAASQSAPLAARVVGAAVHRQYDHLGPDVDP